MAVQYNPGIVTDGLVLCLDAANRKSYTTTGLTWINLITADAASQINGVTYTNSLGGIMTYDGVDDYTQLPLTSIPSGSQITVSVWQNITTVGGKSSFWANEVSNNRTFQAHIPWSDNNVYWDAGNLGANWNRINKVTTATERTGWHNWSFTKNATAGNLIIYLDGASWHSGSGLTYTMSVATNAQLGNGAGTSFPFAGTIGHFSIYNRQLNATEILQNFNALRGRFGI